MSRVGVLISGRGSNMVALARAAQAPGCPVEIALVLSNFVEAPGLAVAAAMGLATAVIDHRAFPRNRAAHEAAIAARLEAEGVEIVCLAGYMRLLTPFLVGRYAGRMLNVHPSLLPAFPGLDTHARALAAGVRFHGCTVHLVTEVMDEGPILAQAVVPVLRSDTEDSLAARVLAQEHIIYPAALARFASGERGVEPAPELALVSPGVTERNAIR
jgi:formyltetrahydrofolate-dependent phosphoribosylglycinamide formyltransferase